MRISTSQSQHSTTRPRPTQSRHDIQLYHFAFYLGLIIFKSGGITFKTEKNIQSGNCKTQMIKKYSK